MRLSSTDRRKKQIVHEKKKDVDQLEDRIYMWGVGADEGERKSIG
jgi:hypothetical protein